MLRRIAIGSIITILLLPFIYGCYFTIKYHPPFRRDHHKRAQEIRALGSFVYAMSEVAANLEEQKKD